MKKKLKLNDIAEKILNDGKAENIISISLEGKSSIADYMVIATGTSNRHVIALSNQINIKLKNLGFQIYSIEGQRDGNWVLVDAGDIIIHLFKSEVRDYYNLDKMWSTPINNVMKKKI